ncbi:cilia- and flagella-associated protein 263-like [Convolutriloba macropyga]|uniref:cilia- and flagella-associated protein 263-like n=1 Tax=Convolutriloba macropyga TaxID=536237 RepID=UPI003F51C47B
MTESESGYSGVSNDQAILDDINELSNEELQQKTHEALRFNQLLHNETVMFETFLKRVDPKDLLSGAIAAPQQSGGVFEGRRRRSKSRSSSTDRLAKLSAEQKLEIAQKEYDELVEEQKQFEEEAERDIDTHNAILQESKESMEEVVKAQREFEREIVKGAVNNRTGQILAEKIQRHFEEKLRAKDAMIDKTRLKNNTLKASVKKMKQQLKQKEEMGEILSVVDFKQLKIENQQYLNKIDDKNQELLRLKLMAGNTMQVLNKYKSKLNKMTEENRQLNEDLEKRNFMLDSITKESSGVEKEQEKAYEENQKLRGQLENFRVPEVIEYVRDKAELTELKGVVRSWERKVEIAEMSLKTHQKTWQRIRSATKPSELPWKQLIEEK